MGPALGSFSADQINDATMNEFLEARQRKAIRRRGRPLSNGTLLQDVTIAQTILNYAKKKKLIDISVHLTKPEKPAPKEIWFDRGEIRRLLDEVEGVPHLYTATLLMLATAGRVAAVLELTWDRVDFKDDWIDLRIDPKRPAKGRARIPMNRGLRNHLFKVKDVRLRVRGELPRRKRWKHLQGVQGALPQRRVAGRVAARPAPLRRGAYGGCRVRNAPGVPVSGPQEHVDDGDHLRPLQAPAPQEVGRGGRLRQRRADELS